MPVIHSNSTMSSMYCILFLQVFFILKRLNIIGNGVVIDPAVFKKEIETLGLPVDELTKRLIISARANLILPGHRILDAAYEHSKGNIKNRINT